MRLKKLIAWQQEAACCAVAHPRQRNSATNGANRATSNATGAQQNRLKALLQAKNSATPYATTAQHALKKCATNGAIPAPDCCTVLRTKNALDILFDLSIFRKKTCRTAGMRNPGPGSVPLIGSGPVSGVVSRRLLLTGCCRPGWSGAGMVIWNCPQRIHANPVPGQRATIPPVSGPKYRKPGYGRQLQA